MSIRNLSYLFNPASVAVIGASGRPGSVGATVLRNVLEGGFKGEIYPVNPKYDELQGVKCYRHLHDLPHAPDLAVICTPPVTVPGIIRALGKRGTHAAVVITAGMGVPDGEGVRLTQHMLDAARPQLLRILGPNCVGMLVPGIGLNASFAHTGALPGRIAFISQSGALVTAVLDWARSRGIGFSKFISMGESADVDFGDVLDYLASDPDTRSILMYVEDVRHARKFMSAARAAARSKPVMVVKAGRAPEAAKAAASHTGALAGSDLIYDAALRRAGMLRVLSTDDLFDAVETLARARPLHGERLAILTNGGGPGVMATDALIAAGGKLAELSPATLQKMDGHLPSTWSRGNPVDIIGDAPVERYRMAMQALLDSNDNDAILFIHAPTAIVPSAEIARALVPLIRDASRNVLACWLGADGVREARQLFGEAGIPTFDTPEEAVQGFMQIVQYRRNQMLLMQVPPALAEQPAPQRAAARKLIDAALAEGRTMLTEPESKQLLDAYHIPVVQTRVAADPEQAVACAEAIGFPVAVKILSPDITHKSDVGGVALDLEDGNAVRASAEAMRRRLQGAFPDARLSGFTVQAMARRPLAHELIVGVSTDPVFGPVILFGQGGTAVEVMSDSAIQLPPLNRVLARDLVSRTRVARLLQGYRNRPPADIDAICDTLMRISALVVDLDQVVELDINPLLADERGVIALDARVRIGPSRSDRLAIRPYPEELEEAIQWRGQDVLLRPIRPEDGEEHVRFFEALDPDDVRFRMFTRMRELSPSQLARMTQIDYDREMAFVAVRRRADGTSETLGVVRAIADPDNQQAEFAVIVRSDMKGHGLGSLLMNKIIDYCRSRGTGEIIGEALAHNRGLIRLVLGLGFEVRAGEHGDDTVTLRLPLTLPMHPAPD
ncbi:bifunctional acetate--CoA ligase family protein/GNAT family N-acetyltransferase [Lacisediminimonas profundi]|uniref:bifunctional acetate--CoA ligase family protein/GNAT family N-acetyltransferase n=1 Tax=Lacisediminimonas profundi TaxID=2603856 RepID=UPI00124B8E6C|nr:bifunctional acetate--CoA ligase family protein/GNAT family N-acetyltransferase [Lacisediminimonas profundi]